MTRESFLSRQVASVKRDWRDGITHPWKRNRGDKIMLGAYAFLALLNLGIGLFALISGRPTGIVNIVLAFVMLFLVRVSLSTAAMTQRTDRMIAETTRRIADIVRLRERQDRIERGEYGTPLYPPADWTKGEDR